MACTDIDAKTSSLVSLVTDKSKPFVVVYGLEGLGKTTVVQNVYNKPKVRHQFTGCVWITVTQHLQHKSLWKDILSQIHYGRKDDELNKLTDRALFQKLYSALRDVNNKYLIVLDGICSMEGWEGFLTGMAADDDDDKDHPKVILSKVVVTTTTPNKEKTEEIVKKISGSILEMHPLTEDQSWLFLKTQLLSNPSVLSILQSHRLGANESTGTSLRHVIGELSSIQLVKVFEKTLKKMCKNCEGVPLALKLLGNLAAFAWSNWKTDDSIWNNLQQRSCRSAQDLLEFSYSLLEEHLKKCLYYLALFPKETVDIEAEKLCNLWIAEEMITTSQQAETYLNKLATLGLVQVEEEETPTPTKIKSCSLPHYVRDYLCRVETEEQRLFATEDLRTRSSSNQEARRPQVRALAFYFDKRVGKHKFPLKPKETHENVRSILFLNTRQQDAHLLSTKIPKPLDLTNCKLLRALDFNWLDFHAINFPQHINNLAHLRYLSFRDCYLEEFPESIEKLEKLETLDLRVNPEVVCKMKRISKVLHDQLSKVLRHQLSKVLSQLKRLRSLYLPENIAAETCETKELLQLGHLSELENLQNFVSTHCRANDLSSLTKLRFLGATIVGKVQDLKETIKWLKEGTSKSSSIHLKNIGFTNDRYPPGGFTALSELLACQSLNALHVHGQIGTLRRPISDKLAEIFLIDSELKDDPMPLLGKLGNLQKLGLSNNAFLVKNITCTGFPELRYLELSILPELKTWTLQEGAMLKLSTLIVENCESLQTLPDGLSSTRLQELSIVSMPKTFTDKYERKGKADDLSKIKHVLSIKIINPK